MAELTAKQIKYFEEMALLTGLKTFIREGNPGSTGFNLAVEMYKQRREDFWEEARMDLGARKWEVINYNQDTLEFSIKNEVPAEFKLKTIETTLKPCFNKDGTFDSEAYRKFIPEMIKMIIEDGEEK